MGPLYGRADDLLEAAPFGVLVVEGRRTCAYANPCAAQLLGLQGSAGRLPEAAWVHLLDTDRAAVRRRDAAYGRYRNARIPLAGFSPSNEEEPPGRWVRWSVAALGTRDVVFLLDNTHYHQADEAAHSLINDLSHELRTPLATMLTHLEVLGLPDMSKETASQSIRLLKSEAQRMARLVQSMLELGRLESAPEIEQRPVDLLPLVEELVDQMSAQANDRRIGLSIEADEPLPLVMGDTDRLRQVLFNLMDNAVKYSRPGDRVVVSLELKDDGVSCAVCDTGPGIPAVHLPHVTRRFYRAAPHGVEGSGVGLALVT
ncbi:MAG: ATP-binding protein, partial [Dehalococcoidia bacterium]|nr:ATP-binding protein [Dehalococcoidia bacterium]